ncbi:MAG: hypothetical protein K6B72_13780 [Lachnospiraceae bacterium]|nr:hypothetical protein [Lachnospiraceae bacterium]
MKDSKIGNLTHRLFGERPKPLSATAGALTSLSCICLVSLVLHHKKLGLIIALVAIVIPLPALVRWIVVDGNVGSIPGLFTTLSCMMSARSVCQAVSSTSPAS